MKHLIGGLFGTQEHANQAYEALKTSGYADERIHQLVHRPGAKTARSTEVSVQDIAKNAFVGGLIGGIIGGLVGFLLGIGIVERDLPYVSI